MYFLFLRIKIKLIECYSIQETNVFQIYILDSPENKTNKTQKTSFPLPGNPFSYPDGDLGSLCV